MSGWPVESRGATVQDPVSPDTYRALFAAVACPVAVATTRLRGRPHGTTVSAFGSLSLDPPLVQVSLNRQSALLRMIRRSRLLGLSVLADDQGAIAEQFARKDPDKMTGDGWSERHSLPVLLGSHGWLTATVERVIAAGDHMIVVGLIFDAEVRAGRPLVYHSRRFHTLAGEG